MDYVWKKWWRHVEGVVSEDNGFTIKGSSDWYFFDVDPEDYWQEHIAEEGDPRYMHVDDLFDNEADAVEAAQEWCLEQKESLHDKMKELGIK